MSDLIVVDTDVVDLAAADAEASAQAIDTSLTDLSTAVATLGDHWLGDASDAHAASHTLWKVDATAYQAALVKVAAALKTTSATYTATETAVESSWL